MKNGLLLLADEYYFGREQLNPKCHNMTHLISLCASNDRIINLIKEMVIALSRYLMAWN